MSSIQRELQEHAIRKSAEDDNGFGFDYELTWRERMMLAVILMCAVVAMGLAVYGAACLWRNSRIAVRAADDAMAESARVMAASEAECRAMKAKAILMKTYRMGYEHDRPIDGPVVSMK